MKVGYQNDKYYYKRNVTNIVPDADYVKAIDVNKLVRPIVWRANRILGRQIFDPTDLAFSFTDFDLNRVDLLHFFNAVSFGTTPWITTFETIVPRFRNARSCHIGRNCDYSSLTHEPKTLKALQALSGDACRKLIALSKCSLKMQVDFLDHFPEYRSQIEPKLINLHPPQPLLIEEYDSKQLALDDQIRFMFVGNAFFRKGGIEILESFQEARKNNGYDLRLIIVSSLSIDDYATKETKEDVARAKRLIDENRDWVEYSGRLRNQQVIDLMKSAHIGLLPTYADTYGYSVLEFQAAGCPVISTNVRALPEINDNEMGWVIEIPRNRLGEAIYVTHEDRAEISALIKNGLASAISEIMENRLAIRRKASAALKHIKDDHSPTEYARRLGELYHQALALSVLRYR